MPEIEARTLGIFHYSVVCLYNKNVHIFSTVKGILTPNTFLETFGLEIPDIPIIQNISSHSIVILERSLVKKHDKDQSQS